MDLKKFRAKPLMGILRGVRPSEIEPLLEAILPSGLETLEITMNTSGAPGLIQKASRLCGKKMMIGAGTVLTLKDLDEALDAGATFIVSPVLVGAVVKKCVREKIPVFPGALTPQEVYAAWDAGAAMVKVFPAGLFGPPYFRELRGPFKEIKLMACSGVTLQNLPDYFANGADAVAIGASVFRSDWIKTGRYGLIRKKIESFLKILPC